MAKQKQQSSSSGASGSGGGCGGCGCLFFLLLLTALAYFAYTRQPALRAQAAKYGIHLPEVRLPSVKIPAVKLPWSKATPTPPPSVLPQSSSSPEATPEAPLPAPTETPAPTPDKEDNAEVTSVFQKEIPAGARKHLIVTVRRGDVTITADSPGTIRITATRRVAATGDADEANRWKEATKVIVEPKGADALLLRDVVPDGLPGSSPPAADPPRIALDIEIHVPAGWKVTANDTLGTIRATGSFRSVELTTATGDILAEKAAVAEVALLKAGAGSLSFLGTAGVLNASTGSGDIFVGDDQSPALAQKRMEATTGVGSVVAELLRAPQSQLTARAGIGDVQVRLPRNVRAKAQMIVGKGWVSSGIALAKQPDGSLSGALNGGGTSTLRLEAATGNARLEGR